MIKNSKDLKLAIIGLGYVGLPLSLEFAKNRKVIGFDINKTKIEDLKFGNDKNKEFTKHHLQKTQSLKFTSNIEDLKSANCYIITVPTPVDSHNKPDLKALINASKTVGNALKKSDLVIYESTVYPGCIEEKCVPVLEKFSNLKFNKDFFCGYSPERINPGDKEHTVTKILKVTSGSTPEIAKKVDELYKQVITAGTYLASSIKVAEASKVIENIQRDVNIALINELALIFDQMGIDTSEVIEAAATKWNFIKLTPGLVGGHCIGIDPYYLTFKAEEIGYRPDLILAARQINNSMGKYIADKTIKEMIKTGKVIKGSEVLILGVTFKEDCPDMRNTKVVDIIEGIKDYGVNVDVYDPWVGQEMENKWYKHGIIKDPMKSKKRYDAIVVALGHKQFKSYTVGDYMKLSKNTKVLIDVKNIVDKATWTL
mgnify:CR=1 FL=1